MASRPAPVALPKNTASAAVSVVVAADVAEDEPNSPGELASARKSRTPEPKVPVAGWADAWPCAAATAAAAVSEKLLSPPLHARSPRAEPGADPLPGLVEQRRGLKDRLRHMEARALATDAGVHAEVFLQAVRKAAVAGELLQAHALHDAMALLPLLGVAGVAPHPVHALAQQLHLGLIHGGGPEGPEHSTQHLPAREQSALRDVPVREPGLLVGQVRQWPERQAPPVLPLVPPSPGVEAAGEELGGRDLRP
eukprot:CAMPEP_0195132070 /NCGR_PEP_ID=MMETSP0448-20130528/146215_1 /TAXON_ID=66468 /ORGANISM="Heterocapsa triquestra, Strain CCMP 448" /LENGTH=251 /DNA_ID=CAMNT_0040170055 /DNA_START=206 /DNA_END=957 /DNA_ORIENTATION=+